MKNYDIINVNIALTENGFLVRVQSKEAEWYYCATNRQEVDQYVNLLFQDIAELPKIPEPPKPPMMKNPADRIRLS